LLRILRRHPSNQLEVAHLDGPSLELWAERGFLRRNDLCSVPDFGTVSAEAFAPLTAPLARGRRRDLHDLLLTAGLATAAGLAVKWGGATFGVASLPLVAAAHLRLQRLRWRREVSLETLPQDAEALARLEDSADWNSLGGAARRLATVGLVALSAVLPVGLFAKFGLAALSGLGARRFLLRG